jgi:DNA polymerase-3 subunit gamma/tau
MADVPSVALYRRFRPGRFEELRGQDHVVRALRNAIREGRVSHAYLFSGPRGTGKTSSARILAKALNCLAPEDGEPCGQCASCTEITRGSSLDVHELDAASNNGVDAMRDLIAHAALGTPGRWKVYIIDEVHMLSTAAANSLLKTLEEPPGHVVFILATTDPQKVPPTIRSRTQHLEFRLLSADTLQELLESVRQQVGLDIDDLSLQASVRKGRGSARDALSALDQVMASGMASSVRPELHTVVSTISEGDGPAVLVSVNALLADGWTPQQLATELVDDLRQAFLAALAPDLCTVTGSQRSEFAALAKSMGLARVVRTIENLGTAMVDMREAPDPQVVLEIAVLQSARPDLDEGVASLAERIEVLERAILASGPSHKVQANGAETVGVAPEPEPASREVWQKPTLGAVQRRQAAVKPTADAAPAVAHAEAPTEPSPAPPDQPATALDRDALTEAWGNGILHRLPARAKAVFSAGRFVTADETSAEFALPNAAHRDRCADLLAPVEAALTKHFGRAIRLNLTIDTGAVVPQSSPSREIRPQASTVGGGEMDEHHPDDLLAPGLSDADMTTAAEARLFQAFPGTSEVTE